MSWVAKLEGGPKRVNHAAVALGEMIYSFGGYCTGESLKDYTSIDVHILNTVTNRWIKHPVSNYPYLENDDILPFKRYGHTAVIYKDKIYIWGGRNYRTSCAVLFCFDTFYNCWSAPQTTGDIPLARDGHSAIVWKHYMYIFGGFEEASNSFASMVHALDLETMNWTCICTSGPKPSSRDFHTAVCLNDRMYIFGGRSTNSDLQVNVFTQDTEMYSNILWYLDLKNHVWHSPRISTWMPVGRRSHSAFTYNNKMYIFGGFNALVCQHFNDLHEFDPKKNLWRRVKTFGSRPCKRRRQVAIMVKDRLFLFGGTSPMPGANIHNYNNDPDDNLTDHSDMYILDFRPSLKTLCITVIIRNGLDYSELPETLWRQVNNTVKPNNITVIRPGNSAG